MKIPPLPPHQTLVFSSKISNKHSCLIESLPQPLDNVQNHINKILWNILLNILTPKERESEDEKETKKNKLVLKTSNSFTLILDDYGIFCYTLNTNEVSDLLSHKFLLCCFLF